MSAAAMGSYLRAPPFGVARVVTRWVGVASVLAALAAPAAGDVSVRASLTPRAAQLGQTITLSIDVEGAQNVQAPALSGLEDFEARYVGPSTQVSIVNGQMSSTVQHRYALTPRREGTFTLGPFTVEYDGQQYQTQPLQLSVTRAAAAPAAPEAGQDGSGDQVRLIITMPKNEVYLHEVLPIDVTLYVGSIQVSDVQYPTVSAEGMSLDPFDRPRQFGQMIDGRRWDAVQFHTNVVPLQAGERLLGPALVRLNIVDRQRQGGMFNDPFFNAFGSRRRPAEMRSAPVSLTVLPLPEEGRPATFSGAVGQFTMQVSAAPTELRVGDPVTLKIAVRGAGNLADARPPALFSTEGFKTYDPQIVSSDAGALRVFEQVLIPNDTSVTGIPPVHFAYFDPTARTYRTIESEPIAVAIRPAEGGQETRILGVGGEERVTRERLGRDIVYIKDDLGAVRRGPIPWYGSWLLLLWMPIPPLLLVAATAYDRRRRRLSGDVRYARFLQARRNARRGLTEAEAALKRADPAAFYDQLSRCMQTYLSDKLGLPPGAVDASTIAASGISTASTERLRQLLDVCEQVRFAPTSVDGDMNSALAQAKEIIGGLERECTTVPSSSGGQP